jgi:hypothetical protein
MKTVEGSRRKERIYAEIVAKTWLDPKFKRRFLSHPAAVLRAHKYATTGHTPVALELKIPRNAKKELLCFLLPPPPRQLRKKAAGKKHLGFRDKITAATHNLRGICIALYSDGGTAIVPCK